MKRVIIPPVFVLLSLILIVFFWIIFPEYNVIPSPFNFIGILISFSGFVLMGKTRDLFKKYQTTLDIEKSSYMITEGVFSKTRNPMYVGMFLFLIGISICFMNLFSMIIPLLFLFCIQQIFIPKEEMLMKETFGEEYEVYRKKVKRWI